MRCILSYYLDSLSLYIEQLHVCLIKLYKMNNWSIQTRLHCSLLTTLLSSKNKKAKTGWVCCLNQIQLLRRPVFTTMVKGNKDSKLNKFLICSANNFFSEQPVPVNNDQSEPLHTTVEKTLSSVAPSNKIGIGPYGAKKTKGTENMNFGTQFSMANNKENEQPYLVTNGATNKSNYKGIHVMAMIFCWDFVDPLHFEFEALKDCSFFEHNKLEHFNPNIYKESSNPKQLYWNPSSSFMNHQTHLRSDFISYPLLKDYNDLKLKCELKTCTVTNINGMLILSEFFQKLNLYARFFDCLFAVTRSQHCQPQKTAKTTSCTTLLNKDVIYLAYQRNNQSKHSKRHQSKMQMSSTYPTEEKQIPHNPLRRIQAFDSSMVKHCIVYELQIAQITNFNCGSLSFRYKINIIFVWTGQVLDCYNLNYVVGFHLWGGEALYSL